MVKKRHCGTSTKRTAAAATKATRRKLVVGATAVVGILLATAHVFHVFSLPAPPQPPVSTQDNAEPVGQIADGSESSLLGDAPMLGVLTHWAGQRATPPLHSLLAGPPPGQGDALDLSTPSVAVYSALALIDKGATDQLAQCCVNGIDNVVNGLYPCYLGHPIELVDVNEEDNAAKVTWKATVHTRFSLNGRSHSPSEYVVLTTPLIRVDRLWKLLRLQE